MKQRVCIAMAILLSPKVIIADEPTSALDVVVQRQVMETLRQVQEALGASVILVGHDMGLMAQFVDRIGVMYGGKLVEVGPVRGIFKDPLHPYTQLLIKSLPNLQTKEEFRGIPGLTPSLLAPAAWLHVPSPLPARHAALLGGRAGAGGDQTGALGGLPPVRRERRVKVAARSPERHPDLRRGPDEPGHHRRRRRRLADRQRGQAVDHRHRRRERQRQDHPGAAAAGDDPADEWLDPVPRPAPERHGFALAEGFPSPGAGHLPGPVRGLQPGLQGRSDADYAGAQVRAGARRRTRSASGSTTACVGRACGPRRRLGATRTS